MVRLEYKLSAPAIELTSSKAIIAGKELSLSGGGRQGGLKSTIYASSALKSTYSHTQNPNPLIQD